MKKVFYPADILLPKKDFEKWAVIACDQFTSDRKYWSNADSLVGGAPSTLRITLPEVYLEDGDTEARIAAINAKMDEYLSSGVLEEHKDAMIYVERTVLGQTRRGIVGAIALDDYDYAKGGKTLVRATEQTVIDRIPPRVKIRRGASLELPHVMLLIDDIKRTVIEPLADKKSALKKAYDFELMLDGGHVSGYFLDAAAQARVISALESLADGVNPLLFAVGDGNHSLATAKECAKLSASEKSKFALVEVVNIHDESLNFEPIYRVLFNADKNDLLKTLHEEVGCDVNGQKFTVVTSSGAETLALKAAAKLPIGTLQPFLDRYLKAHPSVKIDYIHGEDEVTELCKVPDTVGFIFAGMTKAELFPAVAADGSLPRKTFSMGHARDKRYYIEARKIK